MTGRGLVADVVGCPNVEVQAVLAESVIGFEPAGVPGLERCGTFLVVGQVGIERQQGGAAEPFRGGVGDPEPGPH
jgi:hypothetical protein